MSNFSNLFSTYSDTEYRDLRDNLLKKDENLSLYSGNLAAGKYGFGQPYTIGYGYDFSKQTGAQIIADFKAAMITANGVQVSLYTLLSVDQITKLQAFTALQSNQPIDYQRQLQNVNTAFQGFSLSETQASSLLDASVASTYDPRVQSILTVGNAPTDVAFGNTGLHILLLSETYNGVFGRKQAGYIASDDVKSFLSDVIFYNNTKGSSYDNGLENRRMNDLAASLGIQYNATTQKLNYDGKFYPALYIAQAITTLSSDIDAQISSLKLLNPSASVLSTLKSNLVSDSETTLKQLGYYVVQPGDTAETIAQKFEISVATLDNLNVAFTDASFSVGGILHVPGSVPAVYNLGYALPTPLDGSTYVYDASTEAIYKVGSSTDSTIPAGSLVISTPSASGAYPTFAAGTYSSVTTNDNGLSVGLVAPGGLFLGTYNLDPSITLVDGTVINLPANAGVTLTDNLGANATPEQVLLSYLSQLGDPLSAAQLEADNYNASNPSGTPYKVSPDYTQVVSTNLADVVYEPGFSPGAVIAGPSTVTVTEYDSKGHPYQAQVQAYNILEAAGVDLAQDNISGIQELVVEGGGHVGMTLAQFKGFSTILNKEDGTTFVAETGGMFDFSTANTTLNQTHQFGVLEATDFSGTTLNGGNLAGQQLVASTFGNDTLIAGNGAGDLLVGGEGVDRLIGGTGGDTFWVGGFNDDNIFQYDGYFYDADGAGGPAYGSVITGAGTGNTLQGTGNLTGATISDVQTLDIEGSLTLAASQLNEFSTVTSSGGYATLVAATGGSYDLAGSSGNISMTAGTNAGTTLIGNDNSIEYLTASSDGNDTLVEGTGEHDYLIADRTVGNNTLSVGDGDQNQLEITYSYGSNTLTAGSGASNTLLASDSYGDNTLTVGGGVNDDLDATSSFGDNILSAGNGNGDNLSVYASDGYNTLTAGNGVNDTLGAIYSFGNNTLIAGYGVGDVLSVMGSNGDNTLIAGNGLGDTLNANNSYGDNTLTAGDGNNDLLSANEAFGNAVLTAGSGASDSLSVISGYGNVVMKVGNGNNDTLIATGGYGNVTMVSGTGDGDLLQAGGASNDIAINGNDVQLKLTTFGNDIIQDNASNGTLAVDGDISEDQISGFHNLITNFIDLTDGQFEEFSDIITQSGTGIITTMTGGIYDLSRKNSTTEFSLLASSNDGTTLIQNNTAGATMRASQSGADTLIAGNGGDVLVDGSSAFASDKMYGGTGDDTIHLSYAADYAQGNGGNDLYTYDETYTGTQKVINNYHTDNGQSYLQMQTVNSVGVSLSTSGNDLIISVDGTPDQITVQNYLVSSQYQLAGIKFADNVTWTNATILGTLQQPAKAAIEEVSGGGSFSQTGANSYNLSLSMGPVASGSSDVASFDLGILNTATGSVGTLGGSIASSGSSVFTLSGAGAFSGLTSGQADTNPVLTFRSSSAGAYSDTITVTPTSTSAQGLVTTLAPETISVTVNVGQNYNVNASTSVTGTAGNDTFAVTTNLSASAVINGASGTNTLVASNYVDISQATLANIQDLQFVNVTLSATELNNFASIVVQSGIGNAFVSTGSITAAKAGIYSIANKTTSTINLIAASNGGTTLIGNNASSETLTASASGTDTLEAGNGSAATLVAGGGVDTLIAGSGTDTLKSGSGVDTLIGGSGVNTFVVSSLVAGTSIQGGTGFNVLQASGNISTISIAKVSTLDTTSAEMSLAQFNEFTSISVLAASALSSNGTSPATNSGSSLTTHILSFTNAGTYSLIGKSTDAFNMTALSNGGTTLIADNAAAVTLTASASGTDTLQAGSGAGDILTAGNGTDTLIAGTGSDTLNGGTGTDYYKFGSSFGTDVINNGTGSAAHSEIDFLSGITDEKLWFKHTGNNLEIDLLGTSDKITIAGWYTTTASDQVASLKANGLTMLDSQVAGLVSAMATYSAAHTSFNTTTATAMPTDTALQTAITTAWH